VLLGRNVAVPGRHADRKAGRQNPDAHGAGSSRFEQFAIDLEEQLVVAADFDLNVRRAKELDRRVVAM
jgi:hypothetical protein